jgi:aryl carrier-like protein
MDEIADIWCETLGVPSAANSDGFFEHGGDSIAAMFLVGRLRDKGFTISLAALYAHPTLEGLRQACREGLQGRQMQARAYAAMDHGLLPSQQRWAATLPPDPDHYNRGWVFELKKSLDPAIINTALAALVAKHEALRTRYDLTGRCQAHVLASENVDMPVVQSYLAEDDDAYRAQLRRLHGSLSLSSGRIIAAAVFKRKVHSDLLVLVFHHLAVDGYSAVLLAEDLDRALSGKPIESTLLPQPKDYARLVGQYALSERAIADRRTWLSLGFDKLRPLPVDGEGPRTLDTFRETAVMLPQAVSAQILAKCRQTGLSLDTMLAAVVCQQIGVSFDLTIVGADIHRHGRDAFGDDCDFSRTVGFLRSTHPFIFATRSSTLWEAAVARAAAIPAASFGFDALRFSEGPAPRELAELPQCEVLLNFNGALGTVSAFDGQTIRQSETSLGARRSSAQTEPYKLKFHGAVDAGCIFLALEYSSGDYQDATAKRLIHDTAARLIGTI